MRLIVMIIVVLTLTSCSKQLGDWKWDPKSGLVRITFGQVK